MSERKVSKAEHSREYDALFRALNLLCKEHCDARHGGQAGSYAGCAVCDEITFKLVPVLLCEPELQAGGFDVTVLVEAARGTK